MGWKSTKDISKDDCLERISYELDNASNEQLADILEILIGDEDGANYRIVEAKDEPFSK